MPTLGLGVGLPFGNRPLFSPLALSDLAFWYDPLDLSSMVIDGSNRVSLWADKSPWSRVNCLIMGAASSNYASSPDSVALSITGDMTIIGDVAAVDYTPAADTTIASKWNGAGNQRSYLFKILTTGLLHLEQSTNGSTSSVFVSTAGVSGLADFTRKHFRVDLDVDNGASGRTATFWTSNDGVIWTQLGDPVVVATAANTFDSTAQFECGSLGGGASQQWNGHLYRIRVYSGIMGTLAFDANFTAQAKLATSFTESSPNAATVTINTSGATGARISGARDLYWGTVAGQPVLSAPWLNPIIGSFSNGIAGNNFDTFSGASATGFAGVHNGTGFKGARSTQFPVILGQRFTVTFNATINSGGGLFLAIFAGWGNGYSNIHTVTNGSNTAVLTATAGGFFQLGFYATNSAVDFTISSIAVSTDAAPYLYADGSNDALKTPPFPFAQPELIQMVLNQVSWTADDRILDGFTNNSLALWQDSSSPNVLPYAGTTDTNIRNGGMQIGATKVLSLVYNGASSSARVNRENPTTGSIGTVGSGGLTVGARADGAQASNIALGEIIGRSSLAATSTYEQDRVIRYLARRGRTAA